MRLQLVFVLLSYFCIILLDIYIWNDIRKLSIFRFEAPLHKKPGIWSKIFIGFSIATLALLTVAICLPRRAEGEGIQAIMWMLFTILTIIISEMVYFVFSILGFLPAIVSRIRHAGDIHSGRLRRRVNTGLCVGLPLALLCFAGMWWGAFIGRNQIEVSRVRVESSRLPASFNGYTIAQISDLHVGTWGKNTKFIENLVDSVNNLNPDLIVFTGDLVNRESVETKPFVEALSKLRAKDGVFSILGNHDYGDYIDWNSAGEKVQNLQNLKNYQKKMGWEMLDNRHTYIVNDAGDSITVIGVGNWGEPPFKVYGDLKKAYPASKFKNNDFKILLSHNPEHWNREVSKISNIDLTLAGHTHAMQMMIEIGDWKWSPAKFKYEQWGGLYERETKEGDTIDLYVNIGAGEVGLPMRVGATPEITLITLEKKQ